MSLLIKTERSIHPPSIGEAQIAVKATGLCGSDLHYFKQYDEPTSRLYSGCLSLGIAYIVAVMASMSFENLWF